jgi:hypothetical protein
MRIGTSSCLFGSSMVLASGLYFRERSSTLYTVITAGEAVEVSSSAAGRAAMVELGLAAGRAARVDQLQQSSKVLVQLREVYRSRGRVAVRCQRQMVDSRRIGAIIGRLIAGITARSVDQFVQIDFVVEAYTAQY